MLDGVPSYMQAVLKDVAPQRIATDLRYLLIGGEKLEQPLLEAIFTQLGAAVAIVNIYGLTEITDINAFSVIRAADLGRTITVGRPLQNNRIYLTDRYGRLQPVGVVGEVCIAGDEPVARVSQPPGADGREVRALPVRGDGALMCRTGDLGRRQPDGTIVTLGADRPPGQDPRLPDRAGRDRGGAGCSTRPCAKRWSSCARMFPATSAWWPTLSRRTTNDERRTTKQSRIVRPWSSVLVGELRDRLKQRLPDYMIPTAFVLLDVLPRTPNGKLDRRALPVPDPIRPDQHDSDSAPATEVEQILIELWQTLLGLERVGVHDDFFALGGHSLLATRVICTCARHV